ncbi:MAG: Gfo/Idh/MocA family oxidoreductase [Bacteroidales bacterium]|nr:Gfo/Idh/MocA family oxidoreductase [Lentimicrobiaceae bacterium]MDD5694558.1 Gfo/Idh/MocA family oxidoreductase [Bacteroidales bacterium]
MNMLKIGVLGAGHLGKIHLKCIREIETYELLGFYDPDETSAQKTAEEIGTSAYTSLEELIGQSDVIDIVTPTVSHFDCASKALKQSKHVFIEKPVVATPAEAMELIGIAREADVKVQVGHVERFNPAFIAARPFIQGPMFIETHRLSPFNPRGTDVPVVLDLMIHDIDIVLSVVRSNVHKISASGVPILSDTPDIANARLEFDNGCVANLTASRISMKKMRKSRFFQRDAYISVDFLDKSLEIIRMRDVDPASIHPLSMVIDLGQGRGSRELLIEKPDIKPLNAIQYELETFALSIMNDTPPPVTIIDGYNALEIAHRIMNKINHAPISL